MAGNQGGKNPQQPKDYNIAKREQQVMELRLAGLEFDEIARRCGYTNASGAWKAWKRVLSRLPVTETNRLREESNQRLNVALAAVWKKVQQGDLGTIDRLVAIEERRAKLMGLDMPKEDERGSNVVVVREVPTGLLPLEVLNGNHRTS